MTETESKASLMQKLDVTKKSVVRLSSRVRWLEIELFRLKSILKRSVLMPNNNSNYPEENNTVDDISRLDQINQSSDSPEIIPITIDSSDDEGECQTMEIEIVDEEQNGFPPEDEENNNGGLEYTPEIVTEDSAEYFVQENEEGSSVAAVGQIPILSPAKLLSTINGTVHLETSTATWNHFHQTNIVDKGKSTIVMLCKYCKGQVNAKLEVLQNHLGKCGMYKKGAPMEKEQGPSENTLDNISHSGISSDSGHVNEKGKERKSGRKKHPFWKQFNTYPVPGNRYAFTAVCKICNENMQSPKLERIKLHVKGCHLSSRKSKSLLV